jgi:hypothetical protein
MRSDVSCQTTRSLLSPQIHGPAGNIDAVEKHSARCRSDHATGHPERGRFPGPVWSQQPDDFTAFDEKIDLLDGSFFSVDFDESLADQMRHVHSLLEKTVRQLGISGNVRSVKIIRHLRARRRWIFVAGFVRIRFPLRLYGEVVQKPLNHWHKPSGGQN